MSKWVRTSGNAEEGERRKIRMVAYLDTTLDADLIDWFYSLSFGEGSDRIKEVMRLGLAVVNQKFSKELPEKPPALAKATPKRPAPKPNVDAKIIPVPATNIPVPQLVPLAMPQSSSEIEVANSVKVDAPNVDATLQAEFDSQTLDLIRGWEQAT